MNVTAPTPLNPLRASLARLHQRVGLIGLLGMVLLVLAILIAWRAARVPASMGAAAVVRAPPTVLHAEELPTSLPRLPPLAEVPRLLKRVERTASDSGLPWAQANYRVQAATADSPPSLEVRCALKGSYPNLRRFVTGLLLDHPSLALREFSLRRPNAETSELEAALTLVIYLDSPQEPAPRP